MVLYFGSMWKDYAVWQAAPWIIHMKRSMHDAIVGALGIAPARISYLDDTGHMSGVDPLLGLDRAVRSGVVGDGDLVVLLAAGTGYTWAATALRWGAE